MEIIDYTCNCNCDDTKKIVVELSQEQVQAKISAKIKRIQQFQESFKKAVDQKKELS